MVAVTYMSQYELVCKSPQTDRAGAVNLELSQDGVVASLTREARDVIQFRYTLDPMVYTVTPSTSLSHMSSTVVIEGDHFDSTTHMNCKFGQSVVPARFVSNARAVCDSPIMGVFFFVFFRHAVCDCTV